MRILGNLPDVVVTMSDERLLQLLKLALSIPTPPPEDEVAGLADLTSQADVWVCCFLSLYARNSAVAYKISFFYLLHASPSNIELK